MIPFLLAILISVVVVIITMPLARRIGLLAFPGEHRIHSDPIPLVGGPAIFLAVWGGWLFTGQSIPLGLFTASVLVFIFGMLDDKWNLPYFVRFMVQITAILILVYIDGMRLWQLGGLVSEEFVQLGRYSLALTIFAAVGVINAVNMIDGIDGLAAGLVIVCLAGLSLILNISGQWDPFPVLVIGALLGFMVFNFRVVSARPAKIFLGDSGSTLLGLWVAWLLITHTQTYDSVLKPAYALWLLFIPLFDTVGVMLRRMIHRKSPFKADRTHTHHYLQALGLNNKAVTLVLIVIGLMAACLALMAIRFGIPEHITFFAFLTIFAVYLIFIERLFPAKNYSE